MNIGNKINELRTLKNISQEKLGSELGVSRQAISKWETGEAIPSMENLISLSKYFNVSLDEFTGEVKKVPKDEKYTTIQMFIKSAEKICLVLLGIIIFAFIIELIVLIIYFLKNGTLPFK